MGLLIRAAGSLFHDSVDTNILSLVLLRPGIATPDVKYIGVWVICNLFSYGKTSKPQQVRGAYMSALRQARAITLCVVYRDEASNILRDIALCGRRGRARWLHGHARCGIKSPLRGMVIIVIPTNDMRGFRTVGLCRPPVQRPHTT